MNMPDQVHSVSSMDPQARLSVCWFCSEQDVGYDRILNPSGEQSREVFCRLMEQHPACFDCYNSMTYLAIGESWQFDPRLQDVLNRTVESRLFHVALINAHVPTKKLAVMIRSAVACTLEVYMRAEELGVLPVDKSRIVSTEHSAGWVLWASDIMPSRPSKHTTP